MTTWDVLRAVRRRWYVALVGALLTLVAAYAVYSAPGVYSTSVDAFLVAPPGTNTTQQVGDYSAGLTSLAGLVEREVNARSTVVEPVSPNVSITSMGIYEGSTIVLPNSGTQFVLNFDSPRLRIYSAGDTERAAAGNRDGSVARVRKALQAIQVREGVPDSKRVTVKLVPDEPQVSYAVGKPTRAAAALLALGLGITVVGCVVTDRLARRIRTRRRPAVTRST